MRDQSSMVFESPCTHWVSYAWVVKGEEPEMDQVVWLFLFFFFFFWDNIVEGSFIAMQERIFVSCAVRNFGPFKTTLSCEAS